MRKLGFDPEIIIAGIDNRGFEWSMRRSIQRADKGGLAWLDATVPVPRALPLT
jgi:hypothetical protein